MGFPTVTNVYHVDKTQLRLDIDQCTVTENTVGNASVNNNMLWIICSTFSALNLPPLR